MVNPGKQTSKKKMLHELLFALNGYHGSIFSRNENNDIQMVGDVAFVAPTEVALMNRLCRLGTYYSRFTRFIQTYGHTPGGGNLDGLHCLYIRAFCQGLHSVLEPYRQALLDVEKQLLADPHLTAFHVQSQLEEFQLLFPALSDVLEQLEVQKAHGCHVLDILHKASACGKPMVRKALFRIAHSCHGVLYKQLSAWTLHGILLDKYGEFFVHQVQRESIVVPTVEQDELGLGVTGKQLQQIMKLESEAHEVTVYEQYGLRAEMLPSYIPTRVAEWILFVGESVQMFDKERKGTKVKHKGSIMHNKENDFAKEFYKLSEHSQFNLIAFEEVINNIRAYAAEQLWRIVIEEADLVHHLRVLKEFYLLGRGELFLAFIDQADDLLKSTPTGTTQHDVNQAFQHAARNVLFEDDTVLEQFSFHVDTKGANQRNNSRTDSRSSETSVNTSIVENGWNSLNLSYTVNWPLHIIFTKSVLHRYNTVFKFLLYVKRVQLELQQCWALQMHRKHNAEARSNKWWLRNHMAFLVDNLQYYLQVDVIESQFTILQEKIQSTRDFEAIRLAHDNFLTSLLSHSFILMKPVSRCLNEILELCHKFCGLIKQMDFVPGVGDEAQLEDITKSFQRHSNLLFQILSSVRSHQASPHLAQLLLRVDFNRYFNQAGGQLGSIRNREDKQ